MISKEGSMLVLCIVGMNEAGGNGMTFELFMVKCSKFSFLPQQSNYN